MQLPGRPVGESRPREKGAGQGLLRSSNQPEAEEGLGGKQGTGEKGTSVDPCVFSERPGHQCRGGRGARTRRTAAEPTTCGVSTALSTEHEGPSSGWRARARGHMGVGERKEPDKVRRERVRDTRGSACANWLGGQGDLGGAHRQGTQKGGQWLSGGGEDYRRRGTEETGVDPRRRGL